MADRDELAKQLIAEADSGDHPQSTSRLMRIAASALSAQQQGPTEVEVQLATKHAQLQCSELGTLSRAVLRMAGK